MKLRSVYAFGVLGKYVKFGVASDVSRRFETVQTGCPYDLKVLAHVDGLPAKKAFDLELVLHRAMARFHVRGEWFRSCPAVLAVAALMRKMPPDSFAVFMAEKAEEEVRASAAVRFGVEMRRKLAGVD